MGLEPWHPAKLRDVCLGFFDGPHATPPKTDAGPVFLGITALTNGRIDLENVDHLSESDFVRWTRRTTPKENDLVFSYETKLGEAALIPPGLRCCLGRRLALMRPDPAKIDPRFLLFYYLSPDFQDFLRSRTITGSTVDRIPLSQVPDFPIHIPSLSEQRAIARILGTLDDKIELNRRMNQTLEGLARALFRSWFVDFDPVTAKAAGRRPVGMSAATAGLFPAAFEDSTMEPIPKGWRVGKLGEIANNLRRGVDPSDVQPGTSYIGLEHMPRRNIALDDWGQSDGIASNKFRFQKGEILFGKLRPYFHKVGVASTDGVCSTDILVVAPKADAWFGVVLGHLSSDELVQYADAGSGGTKMPRTSWHELARYEIVVPGEKAASGLTALVKPIVDRIGANIHQSRTLSALRDALLPRLLSGELRVKDAERIAEEAV